MFFFFFPLTQAIGIAMFADFLAGLVHWAEDTYGTETTPVVGKLLIRPNIVHHHFPRHFTRLSWWDSSKDLLIFGVAVLAFAWWQGFLDWRLWLFAAIGINANQVHKWSHRTRAENGPVISFFQDIRVLQTPRHHAKHHTDPKNTFYCPVTNLVNPLLERLKFWDRVEWLIARATGIRHRHDTSNRGQGPGPVWLSAYRPKGDNETIPNLIPAVRPPVRNEEPAKRICVRCCENCRAMAPQFRRTCAHENPRTSAKSGQGLPCSTLAAAQNSPS